MTTISSGHPKGRWSAAVVALALGVSGVAVAGIMDSPLPVLPQTGVQSKLVYAVTGVYDDSVVATLATAFHCTNLGTNLVEIGVEVFNVTGVQLNDASTGNGAVVIRPGYTRTVMTSAIPAFSNDLVISLGGFSVRQGSARIVAASSKIICAAQLVDKT